MPAPEVSSFGVGAYPPGSSGLTIDGGGFGAFPGSVWIYENADLTGNADELTVNAWNDLQLDVDIPGSLTNTAGTRYLFVQREDLAWSNAFEFTLEAGEGVTLTVQDAEHGHTADNVALMQAHTLAVQDASHGHGVESPTLSTGVTLAVADATHGHAADSAALTQASTLTVQDAAHGHSADSIVLSTGATLVVADALHAHAAENSSLVQAHVLAAQDALHAHSGESSALIIGAALEVEDGLHGHATDSVVLRIPGKIPPPSRVLVVERPAEARRIAA